jgi:hypothetical protein
MRQLRRAGSPSPPLQTIDANRGRLPLDVGTMHSATLTPTRSASGAATRTSSCSLSLSRLPAISVGFLDLSVRTCCCSASLRPSSSNSNNSSRGLAAAHILCEARARRVCGVAEPVVRRAPGMAFRSQVHQRAPTGRQGSARGRSNGGP